uniref:hypothetical protein n=1 Tax=Cephaloticoccus sp. TaxID=1985742 RepID=UPI0040498566
METPPVSAESTPLAPPPAAPSGAAAPPPVPKLALKTDAAPPPADEADAEVEEEKAKPSAPKKRRIPGKPPKTILVLLILVVVLGLAGFFAQQILMDPPPLVLSPRPVVVKPQPVAPAEPASLAGKLVEKAKDVAAEHDAGLADPVAEVIEPEEGIQFIPATAAEEEKVSTTSQSQISANITATVTTVVEAAEASAEFNSHVAGLSITGVFQGKPARALINGRLFNEGDVVDISLGITFDHVESETRSIIFRDTTGATVKRKYL